LRLTLAGRKPLELLRPLRQAAPQLRVDPRAQMLDGAREVACGLLGGAALAAVLGGDDRFELILEGGGLARGEQARATAATGGDGRRREEAKPAGGERAELWAQHLRA